MKVEEFITKLRIENNIIVSASNDELVIKGNKNNITEGIINQLKSRKGEILNFFYEANKRVQEIIPLAEQKDYPLSYGQRRIWMVDQIAETGGLYNVLAITRKLGNPDVGFLHKALRKLVARHEILRTTIRMVNGEPRQIIHKAEDFHFDTHRIELGDEILEEVQTKEVLKPIDLRQGVFRSLLMKINNTDQLFILVVHHIAVDDHSVKILKRDFSAFYLHYRDSGKLQLPVLDFQYKDFAAWQNEGIRIGNLDKARRYWTGRFTDSETALDLPLDFKRDQFEDFEGSEVSFSIPPAEVKGLLNLRNETGATLFMLLTGLVSILLHRYTGQENIRLGTPVNGHDRPELENQVGYYGNLIVLLNYLKSTYSSREVIGKVKEVVLEGFDHQQYPFDLLVEDLDLKREVNRNPLFDVLVTVQEVTSQVNSARHHHSEEIETFSDGVNKFDLTFSFTLVGKDYLNVSINYNANLFEKSKIIGIAEHLKNVTREVVQNPDQPISAIELLSGEEKQKILSFNTISGSNFSDSIRDLLQGQVEKTPDAISLIYEGKTISYREMDKRSNALAHYLAERYHVNKGDIVGFALSADVDRILLIIALVKLGVIFVPLDPEFPTERLRYIIEDTKLNILISDYSSSGNLPTNPEQFEVLYLGEISGKVDQSVNQKPRVEIDPDDVFVILYTSGSSGKPKGVALNNKGLVNLTKWLWDNCSFKEGDVFYQKTNLIFDVSLSEIFTPLCFGGRVLITPEEPVEKIISNIIRYQVTHISFTPTMLNRFVEQGGNDLENIDSLKAIMAAGEELTKNIVIKYCSVISVPLFNLYGPTEASVYATLQHVRCDDEKILIGKPGPNIKIYITDSNSQLMPIGIPGEILIGGKGVASGYLNNASLTFEKFQNDPFTEKPGNKVFRTGDLGCWNEKGEIIFLGRIDNQLSTWGSRIEPGEIENALLEYTEKKIDEVAVVINKDSYGNSHLIAYYAEKEESQSDKTGNFSGIGKIPVVHNLPVDNFGKVRQSSGLLTLYELFRNSVAVYQDGVATIFGRQERSYRELGQLVDDFAGKLKLNYSIAKDDHVGIYMNRSDDQIIAILAVLKCGAVYVPLDPNYPDSRNEFMLNDAQVRLLITDKANFRNQMAHNCLTEVYDQSSSVYHEFSNSTRPQGDDICYICYTSGSTGKPKGVVVQHRSVVDYVLTFKDYFEITSEDSVIQQSSIAFDTFIEEVFPALVAGGQIVILPGGGHDIDSMIDTLNRYENLILSTTPLVINELNKRFDEIERMPKAIISGGDVLKKPFIDELIHHVKLYNTYGPTETTVCATFAEVESAADCHVIGRSIDNHRIYLLNEKMKPVPNGEIGEIYIAGTGVALGYYNNETETRQSFVKNICGEGVIYKSGDLGRWNEKGLLEFCGRSDRQIKISGYRIEPKEVEQAILKHDGVDNCLVVLWKDEAGEDNLVAYYQGRRPVFFDEMYEFLKRLIPHYMIPVSFNRVKEFERTVNGKIDLNTLPKPALHRKPQTTDSGLRAFLKNKLPAFMVPSHFRKLKKLPLTATGKVDRKQLAAEILDITKTPEITGPENETEEKLLNIWKNCLSLERISTDNNLFELGGNSIKATRIISEVYHKMHFEITLKDIFNNPTVKELSDRILKREKDESLLIRLRESKTASGHVFFVPPIIGSSTIFRPLSDLLDKGYTIYGFQYKGFDDNVAPESDIERMAATFAGEVKRVSVNYKCTIIGYSMGVLVSFEMAKILEAEGFEVRVILIDRGITGSPVKMAEEEVSEMVDYEVDKWFTDTRQIDQERIKKLVKHNLKLIDKYNVNGLLRSNLAVIEAEKSNLRTNMIEWKDMTTGKFIFYSIPTSHYGIMEEQNMEKTADLINATLRG